MSTLLVTGGAGFIGCNFVRFALSKPEIRVVVLDKLTYEGTAIKKTALHARPLFECPFP